MVNHLPAVRGGAENLVAAQKPLLAWRSVWVQGGCGVAGFGGGGRGAFTSPREGLTDRQGRACAVVSTRLTAGCSPPAGLSLDAVKSWQAL